MTPLEEAEALFHAAEAGCQFRTVISRSYYASFRILVGVSGPLGFDPDARVPAGHSVHRRLEAFLCRSPVPALKRAGLTRVRPLFGLLVKADYNFLFRLTKADAEHALRLARDIHDWIDDANLKSAFP